MTIRPKVKVRYGIPAFTLSVRHDWSDRNRSCPTWKHWTVNFPLPRTLWTAVTGEIDWRGIVRFGYMVGSGERHVYLGIVYLHLPGGGYRNESLDEVSTVLGPLRWVWNR